MKTFSQFINEINIYKDIKETVGAEEKISIAGLSSLTKEKNLLDNYTKAIKELTAQFYIINRQSPSFLNEGKGQRIIILFGGDKGLVGGLWNNLLSESKKYIKNGNYNFLIIYGSKVSNMIRRNSKFLPPKTKIALYPSADQNKVVEIRDELFSDFLEGSISTVDIVFPAPKKESLGLVEIKKETVLPVINFNISDGNGDKLGRWPIIEPNKKAVFKILLSKYIGAKLARALFSTRFAELLNRAINMEKSGKEVDKIIKKLRINFFSERRRILTKNQVEVFVAHKTLSKYGK